MNTLKYIVGGCGALMLAALALPALAGPREDPVSITGKVQYLQVPTAPRTVSGSISFNRGVPDDMQAKIARYTAQAYSPNTGGILTENNVVQSVHTNGTQTTCTQSIVPTGASNGVGGTGDQVVVLRGDVINVCR